VSEDQGINWGRVFIVAGGISAVCIVRRAIFGFSIHGGDINLLFTVLLLPLALSLLLLPRCSG